jgi:hypothetical protein
MSWLKQPQKGQRVSSTEPNCMINCSIQRLEPIFEAILEKGNPLRPHAQSARPACDGNGLRNFLSLIFSLLLETTLSLS